MKPDSIVHRMTDCYETASLKMPRILAEFEPLVKVLVVFQERERKEYETRKYHETKGTCEYPRKTHSTF